MKPTREDIIDDLQNRIWKLRITTLDDLELEISCAEYEGEPIDEYEDVLSPMGWNTCDRCGRLEDSEVGLLWLDGFDWEEDNPKDQAIIKALEQEGIDYCAICWECVNKLAKKGGYNE